MKYFFIVFLFISISVTGIAQQKEQTPQETARSFMRSGDWDNAILVLTRALQQDPNNLEMQKDLVMSYYYKRDYAKASELIKPMLDKDEADEATFQIAGNIYKALEEVKDAEKMYKKALKNFPRSGPLYSEYGELLWEKKDYSAINLWEKGIEVDPSYAGNYYNAAVYYFYTDDKIWTIIYGEIFVNMEYLTERSTQMKKMLLDAYKSKLFTNIGTKPLDKNKSAFAKAVLQTFAKQAQLVDKGINIETLNMIRTRFILDWYNTYATKYPFKLFDYQQQLIREGMFEAYNQWLFGAVDDLPAFDQWTKTNSDAYNKFTTFQKGRVFKMPAGQYYQTL
jgi:Tfp pilus assembly protein PilF